MRGLRGLLINNAYLISKSSRFPFAVWAIGLVWVILHRTGVVNASAIEQAFLLVTLMIFPLSSLETVGKAMNVQWDSFMKAMPVSKSMIVVSFYVTYILLSAACLAVVLALPFGYENVVAIMGDLVMVHFVCILFFPLVYLLHVVAPDSEGHLTVWVAFIAGAVIGQLAFPRIAAEHNAILIGVGIIAAGYALSIALSIRLDKLSRKGRGRQARGSKGV